MSDKKQELEKLYTLRWHVSDAINKHAENKDVDWDAMSKAMQAAKRALKKSEPDKAVKPAPRPKKKDLWFPYAKRTVKMPSQGKYEAGGPRGLVVHFTAGHWGSEQAAINTLKYGQSMGHCYDLISSSGVLYQTAPLNEFGAHAGRSYWPGVGHSVSRELRGVEITCAGKVDKDGKTWFGRVVPQDEIVHVPQNKENIKAGYYHAYTDAQVKTLKEYIFSLKDIFPDTFDLDLVLGHDEVAGPSGLGLVNKRFKNSWRKTDPGGSLGMTMREFRDILKVEWSQRNV